MILIDLHSLLVDLSNRPAGAIPPAFFRPGHANLASDMRATPFSSVDIRSAKPYELAARHDDYSHRTCELLFYLNSVM